MKWLSVILLCALELSGVCKAQTSVVDSLRRIIATSKTAKDQLRIILMMCEQRMSLPPDTLYTYGLRAKNLAINSGSKEDQLWAEYYIASALSLKGELDTAMEILAKNFTSAQSLTKNPKIGKYYSFLKGMFMMRQGNRKEALALYLKVLQEAENQRDTLSIMASLTCAGWVYMELDQNREAINWCTKAVQVGTPPWFEKYSIMFSNLAANYNSMGNNDSAEYFVNQALYYTRKGQDLRGQANALAILSGIYSETNRIPMAKATMEEALQIRRLIGDPFYIVSDMAELANFYALHGPQQKGISLCQEGISIANRYHLVAKLPLLYNALANNYKAQGDYVRYGNTLRQILDIKDSVFTLTSAKELAALQAKYDVQKKENIILQQQYRIRQSHDLMIVIGLISGLILVSGFFLFRSYRKRQQLRIKLLHEEERRMTENAIMVARESERKRIAADLHDSLGAYAASIAANVKHLEDYPNDPENRQIIRDLKDNSQEVVSQLRDTIWALNKDALPLTSVSDRIKTFIQRVQKSYPAMPMNVIEKISKDVVLTPSHAYHLFRITQEAVNNALRHSNATEIVVVIDSNEYGWALKVSDDGVGIGNDYTAGNGILNMHERAQQAEWKISWSSVDPNGTTVIISHKTIPETNLKH